MLSIGCNYEHNRLAILLIIAPCLLRCGLLFAQFASQILLIAHSAALRQCSPRKRGYSYCRYAPILIMRLSLSAKAKATAHKRSVQKKAAKPLFLLALHHAAHTAHAARHCRRFVFFDVCDDCFGSEE